ncbi:MAG: serine hydrolase [Robiginitomaculum sp.]|nr:serine hydrolase [Robiginitomaculum sp.]
MMNKPYCIKTIILAALFCPLYVAAQTPQPKPIIREQSTALLSSAEIKKTAERALKNFKTPGMSVSVVQNGKVVLEDGFGLRDMERKTSVDKNTLFRIASTSKAFTSAALAILVDEGKIGWDDKVIDTLPGFRMMDPWVTREFTVRDLLVHRSGLGIGAGDLMLWPEPSGFTRDEIIHNLRYLKSTSSFRSRYAYDNLLYIVAGDVVSKASGIPYEEFVQKRIMDKLDMDCFAGEISKSDLRNVAIPYGFIDEKISPIPRNKVSGNITASHPAGGLACNASGMSKWMLAQLGGGKGANGKQIFSEKQRDEMWKPQTILSVSKFERDYDNTHFKAYALGWRKEDMHGYEVISHTGTLSGFQAYVVLVPELNLGITVLNNGSNYGARTSVMQSILKAYMGREKLDWVGFYTDIQANAAAEDKQLVVANDNAGSGTVARPLTDYIGAYKDPWFGIIDIKKHGKDLRFTARKSVNLKGILEPFEHNTFIVRWDNRGFEADAYARFETDYDGKINGLTMTRVDPEADWSFDFQDLDFERVK